MPFLKDFALREAEDESDRKLLADVLNYGFHMVGISDDGKADPLEFVFTIGCYYSWGIPETILYGLRCDTAKILLTDYTSWGRTHSGPWDGARIHDLANFELRLRTVDPSWYPDLLGYALWFYRGLLPDVFPCFQLVWPDPAGHFSDEPDFMTQYLGIQPNLSQPRPLEG